MPRAMESAILLTCLACAFSTGCAGPQNPIRQQLYASQRYARQLVAAQQGAAEQYAAIASERDNLQMLSQAHEAEKQALGQHVAKLQTDLGVANERIANFISERERYASRFDDEDGVMSDSIAGRFQDLANRYPDIEFDPNTGMSRFNGELLFDSGSAELKSNGRQLLQEFAAVLNDNAASDLKVLVVGHTDDQRIAQQSTHAKHPTNWHLSTNRANAVVLALKQLGIGEERLGAMGYSKFHPVTDNYDDNARQMNRRVEIYVLAPDALIAEWDPRSSRN